MAFLFRFCPFNLFYAYLSYRSRVWRRRYNVLEWGITACTVVQAVQAVVKDNSQSNGNGQISTPRGSKNSERISMKLGIYYYDGGMTTCANPHGAATTWVVSAIT